MNALDTLADFCFATVVVTLANLLADVVHAELVRQASVIAVTEGFAKLGMTLETSGTLIIGHTRGRFAGTSHNGCWVGDESTQTRALSTLVHNSTLSIWTTRCLSTRIGTLIPNAGIRRGTIRGGLTTHGTDVAQANMAKETVVVQLARQHTLALVASFVGSTIIIASTSQHTNAIRANHTTWTSRCRETSVGHTNALHFWVASEAFRTDALLVVTKDGAPGIDTTRNTVFTRIDTVTS